MSATLTPGTRVQAVLADEARTELPGMEGTVTPVTEWPATFPEQWTDENTVIVRWDDTEGRMRYSTFRRDLAESVLRVLDAARSFQVGDRYRFKNDVVEITEVIPALDFYDGKPAVRYAWLTEIDVDPAIREHSSRESGRLTGLARAEVFARTATFVEAAPTDTSDGAVTAPTPAPSDAPTTHILDRVPGEPNPLDPDPVVGFTAASEVGGVRLSDRPTVWLTPEQHAALGEPQQIEITVKAVSR